MRLLAVLLVALALTGSAVASVDGAVASDDRAESNSTVVVALEEDGDATVSVIVSFDLTDEADRAAFDALRENETKQSEFEARTERRFRPIAAETANETGREMAVEDTRMTFETADGGDRGVVSVSATWTRFAATDGDRLVVSEPLASGFTADQRFVLEPPEGYELERSTPTPSAHSDDRIAWDADTSLEGFEAVLAPTAASAEASDDGDAQPGPGILVSGVTIVAGVWLYRRR